MARTQSAFDVENALGKLMPRGLSDDARIQLEAVIDDLAGKSEPSRLGMISDFLPSRSSALPRVAAVIIGGSCLAWGLYALSANDDRGSLAARASSVNTEQVDRPEFGIEVLAQSVWIDGGENLGIRPVNEDGDTRQGWSYHGVEEERLLHGDSGYEVIVQREFQGQHFANTTL